MKKILVYDIVDTKYKINHRKKDNFIDSNCILLDIDNDPTEDNSLHVEHNILTTYIMPDVEYYANINKSHNKWKDDYSTRPR